MTTLQRMVPQRPVKCKLGNGPFSPVWFLPGEGTPNKSESHFLTSVSWDEFSLTRMGFHFLSPEYIPPSIILTHTHTHCDSHSCAILSTK